MKPNFLMTKRTFQTTREGPTLTHTMIYEADRHEYHLEEDSPEKETYRLLHLNHHGEKHYSHLTNVIPIF